LAGAVDAADNLGAAPMRPGRLAVATHATERLGASGDRGTRAKLQMVFRVDRFVTEEGCSVLRLSGRIADEDVDVLRAALDQETGAVEIDLRDVSLIDRRAVKVLAFSEDNATVLKNCPAYIREWIDRERAHTKSTESE
jgi:hypothetical protein